MYKDIDEMREPELLGTLLKMGAISPLVNFCRLTAAYKGKVTLKRSAPNFNGKDESHDILKNIAQHINMDGCLLSNLDKEPTARIVFNDTTVKGRVFALMASLRGAAFDDEGASALLQKIGQLFVEGLHHQTKVLQRRQPYHR